MGIMQNNFINILKSLDYKIHHKKITYPTINDITSSKYSDSIKRIYTELGGIKSQKPLNLKKWDIELDSFVIELDEYLHFNRYRWLTLNSQLYQELSKFPLNEYLGYCQNHEDSCLKVGSYSGNWTNESCERQFGPVSYKGIFDGNGSPRWKQRAFYDFIKDLSPILIDVNLVRISIWDTISYNGKSVFIRDLLEKKIKYNFEIGKSINNLITSRSKNY